MLADDPTELIQQLARNAQDALKNLAANLAADVGAEAAYVPPNRSPNKQHKTQRAPAAANARARDVSHDDKTSASRARRALKDSGPDKYLSPGGGYNGSTTGGPGPKDRRVVGGRKKGGGEKLSTGEDVTPDLPAEEMLRLEAIRAQMRNMTMALSTGY